MSECLERQISPRCRHETRALAWWSDLAALIKLRLSLMVVFSAVAGFLLAGGWGAGGWALAGVVFGTGLLAFGAAAFNQILEVEADAQMRRTKDRPVAAGRMHPDEAMVLATGLCLLGLAWLVWATNLLTAVLGVLSLLMYVLVYTPMKRVSPTNTLIGAVPGALPPVMGWTASTGTLEAGGLLLFGLLFFWQLPHFLAIAWLMREDYARAGLRMLAVDDSDGAISGLRSLVYAMALLPISLWFYPLGLTRAGGFLAALLLSLGYVGVSAWFAWKPARRSALATFLTSILYLPLLLGLYLIFAP